MSESSASGAERKPRRALRIPLAALGPVGRRRRLGLLLPVVAIAAVVAGLLVGSRDPEAGAAGLAPPDAALWVRMRNTDEAWELVRRFPTLRARVIAGEIDPEREVRPWLGGELGFALTADGEPLVIAAVADPAGAERFRRLLPRGTTAPAGDFLLIGTPQALEGAAERAGGNAPGLADSAVYRRAAELEDAPVELYAPAAGLRELLAAAPAAVRAVGAVAETPHFEGLAVHARDDAGDVRISARVLRAPGAPAPQEFAPALTGRAPASAAAFLAVPGAEHLVTLLERGGAAATVDAVRAVLPGLAGLDLDRDILGPLGGEAAITLTARGATPVFTLTARTDDPALTREGLARLQEPLAEQLGGEFRALDADAFSLAATPQLEPSYAIDGNVLIASTDASGLAQRSLARRGLAQEPALRAVSDQAGGRIEALAFADLRQLLALGERTGLRLGPGYQAVRDDLRQVRAAGAVVRREESDSTVELFLEIP